MPINEQLRLACIARPVTRHLDVDGLNRDEVFSALRKLADACRDSLGMPQSQLINGHKIVFTCADEKRVGKYGKFSLDAYYRNDVDIAKTIGTSYLAQLARSIAEVRNG